MEDLIKICRYYKGESECPEDIKAKELSYIWDYERVWVEREDLRDETGFNMNEYINYFGMKDFNIDDGVPITLKALLLNRFSHWLGGYSIENDIVGFKRWYKECYLEISE